MLGRLASCILLSILVTSTLVALDIHPVKSQSGNWWNTAWSHRRQISITERSGYPLGDFPIEVIFPHNGDVQANGTDIRAIDGSNEIPSYVEECNSTHAKIVFEISLAALESKTLYIYYGNPSADAPNYPLVPLTMSEGNSGHAIIDNSVYIGWDYTGWGSSSPVELWNDFRIDFNGNNNPTDDDDLIRDSGGWQGGIGRHRADIPAIGLGDYLTYVQTSFYIDVIFADAKLRVYKNHSWVETTQADFLHMFTSSYDFGNCGIGIEQNLVDGENLTYPDPGWFSTLICNSKENPGWMAFRDSSSGYVFASSGFGIRSDYSHHQGGKEAPAWDRGINYCNYSRFDPVEPYDQPPECRIYWYGDNSNNYIGVQVTAAILNNQPDVRFVSDTITVPDDFSTIQEAINNANEGDTIFVRNGTYFEHVVVNKHLKLIGEERNSTIIDGTGSGTTLLVTADNVTVSGFTIRHSGGQYGIPDGGIYLVSASNCLVTNNIVENNSLNGIFLGSSSKNNTVSSNIVRNNVYDGIYLQSMSTSNILMNNTVVGNPYYGIVLQFGCDNNTLTQNTIMENGGCGMVVDSSSHNMIVRNNIISNWNNIYLEAGAIWIDYDSSGNIIAENYIKSNSIGVSTWLLNGDGNTLYHNNFIDNIIQTNIDHNCYWDNGFEGNFWSNYNGSDFDNDGVGDEYLPWESVDSYPLMSPYMPGDINHDAIVDIFDIASIAGIFGCSSADPQYNPHCDVNEDGLIDIFDLVTVAVNFGKEWTPP